jgi:hypothetical protein
VNKKAKAADRRLQTAYGITLADYEFILKTQNYCCAICKRPQTFFTKRMHTDHDHKFVKQKIKTTKEFCIWWAESGNYLDRVSGKTKSLAISKMRTVLKRESVRGILCWRCNAGLRKWNDDPELMESAAKYIRTYQEKLKG